MKIEILEEKDNPLLYRKELRVRIYHNGATPTRKEVREKIEALMTAKKGTVVVDSFKSLFGARESVGFVKIYESKEKALEIEPEHILKKNFIAEEEKEKESDTKNLEKTVKEEA